MPKAKYSPCQVKGLRFIHNADGQIPPVRKSESEEHYDERIHYDTYDEDGFDQYGYSAFRNDVFVGAGNGEDRFGYTEAEYAVMDEEEFEEIVELGDIVNPKGYPE
ncbi:MAG: hypothetical protein WC284_18525 [Candidimonas sp.]